MSLYLMGRLKQKKAEQRELTALRSKNKSLQDFIRQEREERKTQEQELRDEIKEIKGTAERYYTDWYEAQSKYLMMDRHYGEKLTQCVECIAELNDKVSHLESQLGKKETELIEDFNQERKGISKVISNLLDRKCKYKNLKRAMRIINEVINCEYPTRMTAEQAAKILQDDANSYEIPVDTNISKAVSDVFTKIIGIAKKYGLGFSWDMMQNKMLVLKYEPAKNTHSIKDVLSQLNEGLKEKYRFKLPIIKRKQAYNEPVKTEEDRPISVNELADNYCPEVRKKVVADESRTLSFSELWKRHYPEQKKVSWKREYRGTSNYSG